MRSLVLMGAAPCPHQAAHGDEAEKKHSPSGVWDAAPYIAYPGLALKQITFEALLSG